MPNSSLVPSWNAHSVDTDESNDEIDYISKLNSHLTFLIIKNVRIFIWQFSITVGSKKTATLMKWLYRSRNYDSNWSENTKELTYLLTNTVVFILYCDNAIDEADRWKKSFSENCWTNRASHCFVYKTLFSSHIRKVKDVPQSIWFNISPPSISLHDIIKISIFFKEDDLKTKS